MMKRRLDRLSAVKKNNIINAARATEAWDRQTELRAAVLNLDTQTLFLWLSPNMSGERFCVGRDEALALIENTGVRQQLQIEGTGRK